MVWRPQWLRLERKKGSTVHKSRQAAGGCTCLTKELFPSDWARFLLPWFFVASFSALFIWVRGWGWLRSALSLSLSVTTISELSFVVNTLLCMWSLAMVHYYSPGFPPQALTARSIAIDLVAMRSGWASRSGSASSQYHWEMKKYGDRMGELRTCKRSPSLQLAPLGTLDTAGSSVCPAKPDRAHFCPFTGRAVLEMDHYCPWLGNCIGFGTRKPFLLCLWYGVNIGFSLMASISWDLVLTFTSPQRFLAGIPLLLGFVVGTLVLLLVTLFFRYHILLASSNRTTIEDHEKRSAPRLLGVPSTERVSVRRVFNHDPHGREFATLVWRKFESEKPAKNSLFVAMWSAWAYSRSPWDHGIWGNLEHFLGPAYVWGIPMHLGWERWRPWSRSLQPTAAESTHVMGAAAKKEASLDTAGGLGPRDPVGVADHALVPREAIALAAIIKKRR